MILSVTMNPSVDRTVFVDGLKPHDANRVIRQEMDAGGKGVNLSRVASQVGARTLATGFLGGSVGATVRRVLDQESVPHAFVDINGMTRENISIEDGSGRPPTTINERGPLVDAGEWEYLLALVRFHARKASWVAIGGSLPPGVPPDAFLQVGWAARTAGAKVMMDGDGAAMQHGLGLGPDLIKPNGPEATRLLGRELVTDEDYLKAAEDLMLDMAVKGSQDPLVVVSRGAQGAAMASKEGRWLGSTPQVEVKSTIGSGDSLLGGLLGALLRGEPVSTALAWGLAAGSATAMSDGTSIAHKAQIEALLPNAHVMRV